MLGPDSSARILLQDTHRRILRLSRKATDLYATSGSLWRVPIYFYKLAMKKIPFLFRHGILVWDAAHLRRGVANPRTKLETPVAIAIGGGGLGDLLVVARFARDLASECRGLCFDVFCPDLSMAKWAFAGVPGFRHAISQFAFTQSGRLYPLALNIGQYPVIASQVERRTITTSRELARVTLAIRHFENDYRHIIAESPYLDAFIGQKAAYSGRNRANMLQSIAGIAYGGDRYAVPTDDRLLMQLGLAGKKFMTLHGGFDPAFVISGKQATKCYPHYAPLVALLKARFPGFLTVQVGAINTPPLTGCDIDVRGRTTLSEVAAILSHSSLHVDNEGGLVHMAACLGTTSCVIFGPTFAEYFAYGHNINIRPPVCGGCWWTNASWMDHCPRGFAVPICLSEQPPEKVADRIAEFLRPRHAAQ